MLLLVKFSPSSVITSDEALNEKGNKERVSYPIIPLFWTCIMYFVQLYRKIDIRKVVTLIL